MQVFKIDKPKMLNILLSETKEEKGFYIKINNKLYQLT